MKFQAVLKDKIPREKYLKKQLAASQYPNLFIPSLKER